MSDDATPVDFDAIDPAAAFAESTESNSGLVTTPGGEPAATTPTVTEPATEPTATTEPVETPPVVEGWDGYDKSEVDAALAIARGLRNPDGVRLMVGKGLQALYPNIDTEALQRLVNTGQITPQQAQAAAEASNEPAADPNDPLSALADDDVITGAELRAARAAIIEQAQRAATDAAAAAVKPTSDAFQAQREAEAQVTVDATLVELLGDTTVGASSVDKDTAAFVLQHAAKYIDENDWSPASIRTAIVRGHADAVAQVNQAHEAFLARKAAVAVTTPTSIGGSQSTGGEEPPEILDLDQAREAAEKMGMFTW